MPDVTYPFDNARHVMSLGDMIMSLRVTIFTAMSSNKLMVPKVIVFCGPVRDLRGILPPDNATSASSYSLILSPKYTLSTSWTDFSPVR